MKPGVLLIIRRSLRQHALSSAVTVFSVALAAGLLMAVSVMQGRALEAFTGGSLGFDAVLGARGSALQLVLNSLFHLETSPGNVTWAMYRAVREDPRVAEAVPMAVGDNYKGFRIVGTTEEMFTGRPRFSVAPGGRLFDPARNEAVLGAVAARNTGLKAGDGFSPYHGVVFDERMRHEDEYRVVGVLEPVNGPADRVVWIPLEGLYRMSGHVLRGSGKEYAASPGKDIPDEYKEVSAVLLKLRTPQAGFSLDMTVNKQGRTATLAWPVAGVIRDFMDRLGWARHALGLVAFLTALVSAGTILAALSNAMSERRREFAVLRSLGARRRTVFAAVVGEAVVLSLAGAAAGYPVYAAIFAGASWVLEARTGVSLTLSWRHAALGWTPLALSLLGAGAGLLPAWRAYATEVAENLSPIS